MKKELIDIGTWNVNTMLKASKIQEIVDQIIGSQLQIVNVRNWKNVAQNRDRWKKVVEQARTLNRL
jgi:hypothetical protein